MSTWELLEEYLYRCEGARGPWKMVTFKKHFGGETTLAKVNDQVKWVGSGLAMFYGTYFRPGYNVMTKGWIETENSKIRLILRSENHVTTMEENVNSDFTEIRLVYETNKDQLLLFIYPAGFGGNSETIREIRYVDDNKPKEILSGNNDIKDVY